MSVKKELQAVPQPRCRFAGQCEEGQPLRQCHKVFNAMLEGVWSKDTEELKTLWLQRFLDASLPHLCDPLAQALGELEHGATRSIERFVG